jgi:predicted DNA-binding protein (MmcQ/YjbR family)
MVSTESARKLALSFEETSEQPHFEKNSFRVKKKIFATLDSTNKTVCVKLTDIEQSVYSKIDPKTIYPIPNKWGKLGWTSIELKKIKKELLVELLTKSYCNTAPKKLADKYSTANGDTKSWVVN